MIALLCHSHIILKRRSDQKPTVFWFVQKLTADDEFLRLDDRRAERFSL